MTEEEIRNEQKLFREYIMAKYDSVNTADAYVPCIGKFLGHFKCRPKDITADEIIRYLLTYDNLNSRRNNHSAIKLYYKHKSNNGFSNKFRFIPYPEKPQTLPNPISKEEFIAMINTTDNVKHKCILMLGFDCGLRVSEVINMPLTGLDFGKMQVRVIQSKGKKDRVIKMSSVLFNYLIEYLEKYKPEKWLFNGQVKKGSTQIVKYDDRSCQQIVKNCAKKAGIKRNVTFHQNRHGFAVTLLENGTSLDTIRERLGHSSLKTTRIYAPLNNKEIQGTESPLEQIMRENGNLKQLTPQKVID